MPSLLNPNLKISRAKEHLDTLDSEVKKFIESKPYTISFEDDLENREYVVAMKTDFPPLRLGSIAGDFISCLRSSLDHLAWQLAALTTDHPSSKVCFPIHGTDSVRTQELIMKATVGIPAAAVSEMKRFQPYNSGALYKTMFLWRLNKLWSIDKHRYMPLHTCGLNFCLEPIPNSFPPPTRKIVNDRGEMRFPLAAKQYVRLKPRITIDVEFGSEREGIVMTVEDFRHMYQFVSEEVIPTFTGFFVGPPILR